MATQKPASDVLVRSVVRPVDGAGSEEGVNVVKWMNGKGARRVMVAALAALIAACSPSPGSTASVLAHDSAPTPTPVGSGSLAYALDGDIFVAEWDGSNSVKIADGRPPDEWEDGVLVEEHCGPGEYFADGPIWSPDGRYLAYRHADCDRPRDGWDVVISDREGNVVASFPGEGWLISWSPDSTRVAVWVRLWETIGVYGLDGERQALLTVPPGMMAGGDFDPVWLPDGESLMVPYGVEIPLDGSTPRKLPWADQHEGEATYSPDGSRVAYTTRTPLEGLVLHFGEHQGGSFVVAAADGSHAQEVFGARVWKPVWSPTGDRIAFTSGNGTELRVVDVATGTVTLLAEKDGSDILLVLDFSPEGDRILFSRAEDRGIGPSSLWSIHADGSHLRRLVTGTASGDWSSRGQPR
jgi:Tol biopolymer transport system component